MSDLLKRIQSLVEAGDVRISEHGYDELSEDQIPIRDAIQGISEAVAVEELSVRPIIAGFRPDFVQSL